MYFKITLCCLPRYVLKLLKLQLHLLSTTRRNNSYWTISRICYPSWSRWVVECSYVEDTIEMSLVEVLFIYCVFFFNAAEFWYDIFSKKKCSGETYSWQQKASEIMSYNVCYFYIIQVWNISPLLPQSHLKNNDIKTI